MACAEGMLDAVRLLLAFGANINARNEKDETPLHWASLHQTSEICSMLIEGDADVNACSSDDVCVFLSDLPRPQLTDLVFSFFFQGTPLHWAIEAESYEVVELLLLNGASLERDDIFLGTPLQAAVKEGNLEIVDLLIDYGANVNAPDYDGNSPLHIAAALGFTNICEVLVKNEADPGALNDDMFTAQQLAESEDHHDVVKFLSEWL